MPGGDRALWPLVSMAAALAGTMRLPLTSAIFALELTHDLNALPAMLIASVVSYGLNVLVLKHSILTEKVARRGYPITQEYAVDPLERLSVGEVMTTEVVAVPAALPVRDLLSQYFFGGGRSKHPGYPVVDKLGNLLGVITRSDLLEHWITGLIDGSKDADVLGKGAIIAYDLIEPPADHRLPLGVVPDRGGADGPDGRETAPRGQPRRPESAHRHRDRRRPAQGAPAALRGRSQARAVLRPRPDPAQTASGLRGIRV